MEFLNKKKKKNDDNNDFQVEEVEVFTGVPKIYFLSTEGEFNILVQELLGPSL